MLRTVVEENCMNRLRMSRFVVWLGIATLLIAPCAFAQTATPKAQSPSPELISDLTKTLSITPAQARLSAADFSKVAAAVPGMGGFLKAAPAPDHSSGLSSLTSSLPSGLGGLASTAGSFQKLGLTPDMAAKFVPVLTNFVQSKGGASAASLLSGALQ
jgi:hypothetical protein